MQYPANYSPDHFRKGIVLNGLPLGGNTEGGRLQKQLMYTPVVIAQQGNGAECACLAKKLSAPPVGVTITQSESSRTTQLTLGCSGTASSVTAERVAQLLAAPKRNFGSEGVRIARQQQATLSCSTGSSLPNPIILQVCPPLPPPPGPPAPTCILAKNQKY